MSRKPKYSQEFKVNICKRYLAGESADALVNEFKLTANSAKEISRWSRAFQEHGTVAFTYFNHNKSYSKEFKQTVVDEYLSGNISQTELAIKYNICRAVAHSWINKYNNGIENKDYSPNHEVYAMKSRKTTVEERLEIVQYVLSNNNDYKGAADRFSVPYANVYQWVAKYNKSGEDGLSDRRGHKATSGEKHVLTPEEKKDIEIEKLRRELERANMVIEVLKKKERAGGTVLKGFSLVRQGFSYETIEEFKVKEGFTVKFLCETLQIPRSSYYKWLNRAIPNKELQDEEVARLIIEYNETFNGVLGYRQMTFYINYLNQTNFSEGYIHRLMKLLKVKARIRLKRVNRVICKPEQIGENILSREFTAEHPNQKWCTDVTEFKIPGEKKKLYLSAVLDLYDRSIVAYELSNSNNNKLVFDTFHKALEANPYAKPIFHSDRGFQYTSKIFKMMLDKTGMIQSMSRVGKCIDNGPMEGFWGTLKSEMFYGIHFKDESSLREKIQEYIFDYNNWRLQKKLGTTPNQYRYYSQLNGFVV